METFAKFKNTLLVACMSLMLTMAGYIYAGTGDAIAAQAQANVQQDERINQLTLAVERLKTLMEVQVQINERLEKGVGRPSPVGPGY